MSISTALSWKILTDISPAVSASYLLMSRVAFIDIEYISRVLRFNKAIETAFTPGSKVGPVGFVFE